MDAWQERLCREKDELNVRIAKLREFLQNPTDSIRPQELGRLRFQLCAMEAYSVVLAERFAINLP
jgi:hypothetical protein